MKFATTMDSPLDLSIFDVLETDPYPLELEGDPKRWRAVGYSPTLQALTIQCEDGRLWSVTLKTPPPPPTEGSAEE